MRAIVTGAAGFIGSRLAAELLENGADVIGIDRFSAHYDPEIKRRNAARLLGRDGFELVEVDLADADLASVLRPGDFIFHLAAQPGARGGWGPEFELYLRDNVLATQRLLEAAEVAGVARVVFASSSSVYGQGGGRPAREDQPLRPLSPYGVTQVAGERLCALYHRAGPGLPVVVMRYFSVFGPGQRPDMAIARFLAAAQQDQPIEVLGDGAQVRDLTYVDDVVAATVAAATRGRNGATYNVAGGLRTTVLGIIDAIEAQAGKPLERVHLPAPAGEPRRTAGDTTLARAEIGYAPGTSLAAGLALQLESLGDELPVASG